MAADLSGVFAPAGFGSPAGPTSPTTITVPSNDAGTNVPSPVDDPIAWNSFTLGDFFFPIAIGYGGAKVKPKSSNKIDEQKATGKSKAKMKLAGVDLTKVEVDCWFRVEIWGGPFGVASMLAAIDPNGPKAGGPFEMTHPDVNLIRKLKNVLVNDVGDVDWQPGGRWGKFKFSVSEWVPPAKAAAGGGTKTPLTAEEALKVSSLEAANAIAQANIAAAAAAGGQQILKRDAPDNKP